MEGKINSKQYNARNTTVSIWMKIAEMRKTSYALFPMVLID